MVVIGGMNEEKAGISEEVQHQREALEEIPEGGFFCIHCGHINPKAVTYCMRCGRMPHYDAECDGSSSLWHPKDW
ncbi:MAG: hypothetical protein ACE5Z5_02425 [Candidatus Bathyarchaeia archaeon]